jgi:hypothetical protein
MGTCFEVGKKTTYEKFMLYIYSHLLGGWVVLRWVRGRYVLHISLCILFFCNVIYDGFVWSKGMGFFFLLIFSFIMFTMSCYHVCIVIQCIIFAYILHILSFTLKNFLSFYSFIWGNGQKHDSLSYNIFTTIFCRHLHIKSMQ